ncbi:MAG: hypothetical protein QF822_00270 [Candidatus Poseidoniia archaeon]|jgi:hypothetical protein|nr:hypothetical protein [Candidatus Poseidoniia archaeon]
MVKSYNSSKSNTSAVKDGDGGGPDDIDIEDPAKTYNTSKSNTSSEAHGGGGGGPDETQGTDYHTTRDTKSVSDGDLVGDGGGPGEPAMTKNYNSSKSNTSSISVEDDLVGDGGGPGEPAMTKNYNSSKSNTSSISVEDDLVGDGGGPGEPAMTKNYNSSKSNTSSVSHSSGDSGAVDHNSIRSNKGISGGGGSGGGTGVIGSTLGVAKTVIMVAVLLTAAGVGFDLYQTYNDAIDLNLEDHVTDADFALNNDKTEINGDISFNIPEMGMFEKKILAKVHVTVLESNPTTDGDYSFEYTLGSGEHTYRFSLTDLDPVTVEKIDAGEDLELEYTTSITVIYLGVELAPATTDMPAKTVTVETA